MIGFALYYDWEMTMIDLKAAFLNAKSENKTFIKWPTGAADMGLIDEETKAKQCIMLENLMYGTVEAAILWMKEITKHLISKGMKQSRSDPCVFFVRDKSKGLVLAAAIYVDNTLVTGTK